MYNFTYTTLSRTYTRQEWNVNRMQYIEEARKDARAQAPAKVLLYVREAPRRKGVLMVTVKSSPPG